MEKNLINLGKLSDFKCVKFEKRKKIGSPEIQREYFTCKDGERKLVIIRGVSHRDGDAYIIADKDDMVGSFAHYNRYYDFPKKHDGIEDFDYETGANFEKALDNARNKFLEQKPNPKREKLLDKEHGAQVIDAIYSEEYEKLEKEEEKAVEDNDAR